VRYRIMSLFRGGNMDAIKLFFAFTKVSFLTQLEYPARYLVRAFGKILSFGGGFALLAIMLTRFGAIGTWSMYEVLLLYSVNILCYSIGATFAMPVCNLSVRVRNGLIDVIGQYNCQQFILIATQYLSVLQFNKYI